MTIDMRKSSGFSLIEIMVAVMIVALMAAGAFYAFSYLGRAKITKTKTNLQIMKSALEQFNVDTGGYPVTLMDLTVRPADQKIAKRWQGPYLDKEIEDGFNRPFVYQLKAKGSRPPYELYSWGSNGEGSPIEEHISVWDL